MTNAALIRLLARSCTAAGGIRPWARRHKVSHVYVIELLRGTRTPGPKIRRALINGAPHERPTARQQHPLPKRHQT
jgi:hypothetical protein